MGRVKGSRNKQPPKPPHTVSMTTEERLEFLANLIVDKIKEDQIQNQKLLKRIEGIYAARTTTT